MHARTRTHARERIHARTHTHAPIHTARHTAQGSGRDIGIQRSLPGKFDWDTAKAPALVEQGSPAAQLYSQITFPFHDIYLGIVMVYDAESKDGHVHCRLSWSTNASTWSWVDAGGLTGKEFIPHGAEATSASNPAPPSSSSPVAQASSSQNSFDSHVCFAAASPVEMEDEVRVYYMGGNGPHNGNTAHVCSRLSSRRCLTCTYAANGGGLCLNWNTIGDVVSGIQSGKPFLWIARGTCRLSLLSATCYPFDADMLSCPILVTKVPGTRAWVLQRLALTGTSACCTDILVYVHVECTAHQSNKPEYIRGPIPNREAMVQEKEGFSILCFNHTYVKCMLMSTCAVFVQL